MQVKCPHCKEENTLPLPHTIKCSGCGESLEDRTYSAPIISAFTALLIGGYVSYKASDWLEHERYLPQEEYALVESCLAGNVIPRRQDQIRLKKGICFCALKETQKEFDRSALQDTKKMKDFTSYFRQSVTECNQEREM